jgi:hypothetical protein
MKKLNDIDRIDFLQNERGICYWFWFKGKITMKKNPNTKEIFEQNLSGSLEWNGQRLKNGFYNCFNIMSGKWNGQTKSEFDKNYKRVNDIVDKSNGDSDKMISLSRTQAGRIHDEFKALNRSFVAKEMGYIEIFEIFFQRAYELGSVSKQEYREYRLEKLGII